MTIAERIAGQFSDGASWVTEDGVEWDSIVMFNLPDMAMDATLRAFTNADSPIGDAPRRYTFVDGSVLTTSGGCWDLGYPECFCWQGVGHTDDCTANARGTK